jgi:adenylate cyclase
MSYKFKSRNARLFQVYVIAWFTGTFLSIWSIATSPFDFEHFFQSGIAALIGGTLFYFSERSRFIYGRMRKLKIIWIVVFRTLIYLFVITFVSLVLVTMYAFTEQGLTLTEYFEMGVTADFFTSTSFLSIATLMIGFTFIVSFLVETARMLGPGMLVKLLSGSYHSPVEEERIFMFLDLNNSTHIAEKLGPVKFTEFKNNFFIDLADPVLDSRGEVFQYVGDEVVLTWKLKAGLRDARWLNFFFNLKNVIRRRKEFYKDTYGFIPEFKAGCHSGIVFTSEVGDLKKSIVYNGDVVNTASRIEAECRAFKMDLLVSDILIKQTNFNDNYLAEPVGEFLLRGKAENISLWTVKEKTN